MRYRAENNILHAALKAEEERATNHSPTCNHDSRRRGAQAGFNVKKKLLRNVNEEDTKGESRVVHFVCR